MQSHPQKTNEIVERMTEVELPHIWVLNVISIHGRSAIAIIVTASGFCYFIEISQGL